MCAAKRSVETGQPLRDACRNRPEGGPQRYSRFAKNCLQLDLRTG